MNIPKKILSDSEKEDLALLKLMLQEDRTDLVSEKEIFKILGKNGNYIFIEFCQRLCSSNKCNTCF